MNVHISSLLGLLSLLTISCPTADQTYPSPAHHTCYTSRLDQLHHIHHRLHDIYLLRRQSRPGCLHTHYSHHHCSTLLVGERGSEACLGDRGYGCRGGRCCGLGVGPLGRGGREGASLVSGLSLVFLLGWSAVFLMGKLLC
jgi:hypothetical protein